MWAPRATLGKLTGGTTLQLDGIIIYAPKDTLELAGSGDVAAIRAQIFARAAKITGGGTLTLVLTSSVLHVGRGRPLLIR